MCWSILLLLSSSLNFFYFFSNWNSNNPSISDLSIITISMCEHPLVVDSTTHLSHISWISPTRSHTSLSVNIFELIYIYITNTIGGNPLRFLAKAQTHTGFLPPNHRIKNIAIVFSGMKNNEREGAKSCRLRIDFAH